MQYTILPPIIDSFLMWPFRLPEHALLGMFAGCTMLALFCIVIGELTGAFVVYCNRRYHIEMRKKMVDAHNASVNAIHAGSKEGYLANNKEAHEFFGKYFFAQAAIGTSTLWPVPFALGWMSARFEGIPLFTIPFTKKELEYVFLFLALYICLRVLFSKIKKRLPLFSSIHRMQEESRKQSGSMKSFSNPK